MSYLVALALGSNLGDREYYLRSAIDRLRAKVRIVRVSPILESTPVDSPEGVGDYFNAVFTGVTALSPKQLLAFTQQIERSLGRRTKGGNRPRTIDIDLIFHGAAKIRTRRLELPHPRWSERPFVYEGLRAINAPWI